jgi:hypothetical protein
MKDLVALIRRRLFGQVGISVGQHERNLAAEAFLIKLESRFAFAIER